jgi:hypothetical protein
MRRTNSERNAVIRGLRKSGKTLVALGKEFNISRERIRQIAVGVVPNKTKKVYIKKIKALPDGFKKCSGCKQIKSKDEFHKNSTRKDGLTERCKTCAGINVTLYHRKRKHGIGREKYLELLLRQDNKCAICKRDASEFPKELAVDHDHKTGKIRGLLCWGCNLLLGNAKDNKEVLESAIIYLAKDLDKQEDAMYTIESQVYKQ